MTDLLTLIAKVEAACEGSRDLDAEIASALHLAGPDAPEWLVKNFSTYAPLPGKPGFVAAMQGDGQPGVNWEADRFTSSLDAALRTIPTGMGWGVKLQDWGHYAWVDGDLAAAGNVAVRYGTTAPLALCRAALHAHARLPA